jgi:hypothetical protein
MLGLQQLNREAHPRRDVICLSCTRGYHFVIAVRVNLVLVRFYHVATRIVNADLRGLEAHPRCRPNTNNMAAV